MVFTASYMKALILAGGLATRLRPITHGLPKCLLPIESEKTIFDIQVEALAENGIRDIIVVTGYMAHAIEQHANSRHPDIEFVFAHNEKYETTRAAYGLWIAREFVDTDVCYLNADLLCESNVIGEIISDPHGSVTAIVRNEWDEEEVNVVLDAEMRVVEIGKLIERHRNHGEFVGATKLSLPFWEMMMNSIAQFHERNEYQKFAVDSMQEAIRNGGTLWARDMTDKFACEIDTIEDYNEAQNLWRQHRKTTNNT